MDSFLEKFTFNIFSDSLNRNIILNNVNYKINNYFV